MIKELDENFKNKNIFKKKLEIYITYKESIEKRIEEIESFYESNFDEPFVLNYQKGIIQLKKLLIENKPNCINYIDKYISFINNKSLKNLYNNNSNQNISQISNGIKEYKTNNNDSSNNNTNIINNSGSILNNNIFNNKLLLRFKQKEKDLKYFESYQELKKEQELNDNLINNNIVNNNSSEKEESENTDNVNDINDNIEKRNDYGDLFKLSNLTSDKKINTIKSDNNNLSIWKENESNFYKEENEKEDEVNSINEELKEKFRLKEVVLKFILNDEEYSLLIQEKAKKINPFL